MSRVLEHNALLPHFVAALRGRGIRVLLRPELPSYVMRLPRTYAECLAARSAKFRNHLKRVDRKIHTRHADVTVLVGDRSASGFTAAFTRILAIEQSQLEVHARVGHGAGERPDQVLAGSVRKRLGRRPCARAVPGHRRPGTARSKVLEWLERLRHSRDPRPKMPAQPRPHLIAASSS